MSKRVAFLLGFATAVIVAAVVGLAFVHGGISARPGPCRFEARLARAVIAQAEAPEHAARYHPGGARGRRRVAFLPVRVADA